jgi:hypothetical protein
LYDTVRKDILTLLILQKTTLQKEGLVATKRLKLAKRGGNVRVVDEETLLGIAPPASTAQSSGGRGGAKAARGGKSGKTTSVSTKNKGSVKAKPGDAVDPSAISVDAKKEVSTASRAVKQVPAITTTGVKQARKTAVPTKRKRKPGDTSSKSPMPVSVVAAVAAATVPVAAGTVTQEQPSLDASAVLGQATRAAAAVGVGVSDAKAPGKKRAKKSAA